jgi:hypothetical protein
MMATKPRAAAKTADCEECRHFSGSCLANTFTCAKGHARERDYSLIRLEGCRDFAKLSTDEQILKRFSHSAKFNGDTDIKKRRVEVRRTTTSIRKTIDSFGKFMTARQVEALREAATQLGAFGNDLERAGVLANRVFTKAEAQRKVDETARREALVAKHVGDQDALALADDLINFKATGREWLKVHKGVDTIVSFADIYALQNLAAEHRRQGTKASLVSEQAAICMDHLEEMAISNRYLRPGDNRFATLAEFIEFRAWRKSISDALGRAAGGQQGGAK